MLASSSSSRPVWTVLVLSTTSSAVVTILTLRFQSTNLTLSTGWEIVFTNKSVFNICIFRTISRRAEKAWKVKVRRKKKIKKTIQELLDK